MAGQKDLFLVPQEYCFDTSSIILIRQSYPDDIFQTLNKLLTPIFESGKIIVINSVLEELKSMHIDLFNFIKQKVPKNRQEKYENYILITQKIIHTYYDNRGRSHNLKADPHVLACAKEENITVVTEELGSDPTKMPFICRQENIKCINFIEFLRKEGVKV